tara:strand:+ start:786 stop:1949 length:1164 start_codon:yes stop_codon:yes gene_type:complete
MKSSKFVTLNLGIKKNLSDGLLIILTDESITSLVFTLNKFPAAPVIASKNNISKSNPKYIFINSGNANACTGEQGSNNVKLILKSLSKKLKCKPSEIIIMSTGIIGRQLPISNIINSINKNAMNDFSKISDAAKSIMTTDKYPKYLTKSYKIGAKEIVFKGICKGAGMIEPNMATMLGFIETNVVINSRNLDKYLRYCVDSSFNCISVDGDTSTNDCVALTSTNQISLDLSKKSIEKKFLEYALDFFIRLSTLIVKDGEGATKVIKLEVINAKNKNLVQEISKKISHSLLVKTAMYGEDPNWGRIIASLGSIESPITNVKKIRLLINNILCFEKGTSIDNVSSKLKKSMNKNQISITVDLQNGIYSKTMYFSDLSHEYVNINSQYTT